MDIEKNQLFTVRIDSYSSEGFGVCRLSGFVVFVRDAAVGDECEIRIVKVLKSFAYARIEAILTESPARVSSDLSGLSGVRRLRFLAYFLRGRTASEKRAGRGRPPAYRRF